VRVTRTIATAVVLGWMCQSSLAVQPPCIDRPTPPPCCADGQCFASPMTYGYYDTHWRRWPLEAIAQAKPQAEPGKPGAIPPALKNEVPAFVTPPPEQEERKAPPPSVPAGEQAPGTGPGGTPRTPTGPAGPQGPPSPTGPAGPATQPRTGPGFTTPGFPNPGLPSPPTGPSQPGGQGTQPSTQPLYKSVSPDSPLNRNTTQPMGDADPPPALPFGPALVAPQQPGRDVSQQPAATPVQRQVAQPVESPSNDPPPAPPIALVSYEE
jgi:hypothetical protein